MLRSPVWDGPPPEIVIQMIKNSERHEKKESFLKRYLRLCHQDEDG